MANVQLAYELFRQGTEALIAENFPEAERRFLEALELAPGRPSILSNLSIVYIKQGRLSEALPLAQRAASQEPGEARHQLQKGIIEFRLNQLDAARASLEAALLLAPDNPQALNSMGLVCGAEGNNAEACVFFEKARALKPDYADASNNLGLSLKKLGQLDAALASFREAIRTDPRHVEALNNCASMLSDLGQHDEAVEVFRTAISLDPRRADVQLNLGLALKAQGKPEEAMLAYGRAIELGPENPLSYLYRSMLHGDVGRIREAVADLERARDLDPSRAQIWSNLGTMYARLKRYDEALEAHARAIEVQPDYVPAYQNRGLTLMEMNLPARALVDFDQALSLDPASDEINFNKSCLLLSVQSFEQGFQLYQSRWKSKSSDSTDLTTPVPQWSGEVVPGRLLLWAEQGIGDEVFYASLLSLIRGQGMKISLAADKRLHAIFRRSFEDIHLVDRARQAELVDEYDAQAPIGDLGRILRINNEKIDLRRHPFLKADKERAHFFRQRLGGSGRQPIIGVSWKSNSKRKGTDRNIELADMAPFMKASSARFVSLQYGDVALDVAAARERAGFEVEVLEDLDTFHDLDGLLALIECCDLVITIANVNGHLAGAIGKKTIVLLPSGRGEIWYWRGGGVNRWYPSVEVINQDLSGNWAGAIEAATQRVKTWLGSAEK